MARVIRFLTKNNKLLILTISLLSISLFFLPMLIESSKYYDIANEFHSIEKHSDVYLFMNWSFTKFAPTITYPLLCLFLISALLSIVNLFFNKRLIGTFANVFSVSFLSALLVICIWKCLPSSLYSYSEPDEFGRYFFQNFGIPHMGFYISILLFALSILSLVISTLDREVIIKHEKFKDWFTKQKPLKPEERIEILELKLQISELEKQIQESKKDG